MDTLPTIPRSASRRRERSPGLGRGPAASVALLAAAGILLVAVGPAASAAVDRSWRGSVGTAGANGAVTVVALVTGTGTVGLRLKALPRSAPVTVTIRAGTCARPGTVAAALPAARSTSAGTLSRTTAVGSTAVRRMKAATTLVVQVRSSGFSRCAALRRVASPGASPSPSASPSPTSAEVELRAHGFAFSPATLTAAAGVPIVVSFRNDDAGVPHQVAVATSRSAPPIATSTMITGVARTTFTVPALAAGTYAIWCTIHASMSATLIVTGATGISPNPTAGATAAASPGQTAAPTTSPPLPPTPEPTASPEPTPTYSY